jgi:hypothetical protein
MLGNLPRQVEYFEHDGAFAHDAVKFEVGQQLLFEFANLFALGEELGEFIERFEQPAVINRLAEVIVGAAFYRFDGRVHGIVAGHKEDVGSRVALQGLFQEGEAVDSRHFHVQEHDPAQAGPNLLQGFVGIGGAGDRETHLLELGGRQLNLFGLIIHNADWEVLAGNACQRFFGNDGHVLRGTRHALCQTVTFAPTRRRRVRFSFEPSDGAAE